MKKEIFTVWITQYALTQGIYEETVEMTSCSTMVGVPGTIQTFHKPHWHLTKEDAIIRAEEMRIAKLKSLDKQMRKISALEFW